MVIIIFHICHFRNMNDFQITVMLDYGLFSGREQCWINDRKMERQRPEQGEVGRALGEAVLGGVGAVLLQQDRHGLRVGRVELLQLLPLQAQGRPALADQRGGETTRGLAGCHVPNVRVGVFEKQPSEWVKCFTH